ncbi:MAG: hypothetical protein PWP70_1449 [Moorella sp. (in: firmicutes)]|nr:hypothetical protein [Moorella sp. (in: firmicutes)]
MQWQEYGETLKEVLALEGSPVAITYSDEPVNNGSAKEYAVCGAIAAAKKGEIINLNAANCTCPGGSGHIGLAPRSPEAFSKLKKFLVEGEKLRGTYAAFWRSGNLSSSHPPLGLGQYVVFSPLEKATLKPDLVLFVVNARTASRLLELANYEPGTPIRVELTGSTCATAITIPLATGKINLSLIDTSSRKLVPEFKDEELIFSIPYFRLHLLVASIPYCTAGTAEMGMNFEEVMKK